MKGSEFLMRDRQTDRQTDCLNSDIQEHFLHFTQKSYNGASECPAVATVPRKELQIMAVL